MKRSLSGSGKSRKKNPYRTKPGYGSQNRSKDQNPSHRTEQGDRKPSRESREESPFERNQRGSGENRKHNNDRKDGYKRDGKSGRFNPGGRDGDSENYRPRRKRINEGYNQQRKPAFKPPLANKDGMVRLNKYIANSGVCSRREADQLIEAGAITVNGKIVDQLGTKIHISDVVVYNGQTLSTEKKVYILLNKPKDFITTVDDPQGRRTVLDLVENACKERIFPVGRLDRNTTGLLVLTNDGELTRKLTHPKFGVRKLYQVELDKPLTKSDMQSILEGPRLEGEKISIDALEFDTRDKTGRTIGIQLHSGQNRVVRRIFESFDYKVLKLDRTMFAGLSKKDLPRGKWRFLSEKEVNYLRMRS